MAPSKRGWSGSGLRSPGLWPGFWSLHSSFLSLQAQVGLGFCFHACPPPRLTGPVCLTPPLRCFATCPPRCSGRRASSVSSSTPSTAVPSSRWRTDQSRRSFPRPIRSARLSTSTRISTGVTARATARGIGTRPRHRRSVPSAGPRGRSFGPNQNRPARAGPASSPWPSAGSRRRCSGCCRPRSRPCRKGVRPPAAASDCSGRLPSRGGAAVRGCSACLSFRGHPAGTFPRTGECGPAAAAWSGAGCSTAEPRADRLLRGPTPDRPRRTGPRRTRSPRGTRPGPPPPGGCRRCDPARPDSAACPLSSSGTTGVRAGRGGGPSRDVRGPLATARRRRTPVRPRRFPAGRGRVPSSRAVRPPSRTWRRRATTASPTTRPLSTTGSHANALGSSDGGRGGSTSGGCGRRRCRGDAVLRSWRYMCVEPIAWLLSPPRGLEALLSVGLVFFR